HSVACSTDTSCIAVGNSGTILATNDGGTSWTPQTSGSTSTLRDISCPDGTHCFVSESNSTTVLATTDGGTTWAATATATPVSVNSISCPDNTHCVAVG